MAHIFLTILFKFDLWRSYSEWTGVTSYLIYLQFRCCRKFLQKILNVWKILFTEQNFLKHAKNFSIRKSDFSYFSRANTWWMFKIYRISTVELIDRWLKNCCKVIFIIGGLKENSDPKSDPSGIIFWHNFFEPWQLDSGRTRTLTDLPLTLFDTYSFGLHNHVTYQKYFKLITFRKKYFWVSPLMPEIFFIL